MPGKLLILITDLELGGTPKVVHELARRLRDGGVDLEVACLGGWGPVAELIKQDGVSVTALGAKGAWDLRVFGRLRRLLRRKQFTVVYSLLVHANVTAALAGQFCSGLRLIQSIQTTQPYPRWHWWAQAWAYRSADAIIVPSESVAQAAINRAGIPRDKIQVIVNAVDVPNGPLAISGGPTEIGFLGRLDPIKRVDDLIRAVASLGPEYILKIFGEGEDRRRLERLAGACGTAARIQFRGAVPEAKLALQEIGILVLPSVAEGMPMVLLEAMAGGVPVIGTNAPGIRDLIRNGETGALVPVGDVSRLADAIRGLAADPAKRARLVHNACEMVQQHFTWDAVLPQYRKVLCV